MRRAVLGILGLVLLVSGFALPLANLETAHAEFASGVMVKTGAVFLLFWLAYHQVLRLFEVLPPWMIGASLLGIGVIIARPKLFIVVICLLGALLALHYAGFLLKPLAAKGKTRGQRSEVKRGGHSP